MVKKTVFMFLALVFCQCMIWEPLRIKRADNLSGKLRLDGFYYSTSMITGSKEVIFLYSNGVLYQLGDNQSDLQVIENRLKQNFYKQNDTEHDNPADWGAYAIKGDSIYIDRWIVGGGVGDKPREYGTGLILNSTSFTNSSFGKDWGPFQFRQFPIKPDSTNRFVK
jgi:hypothetical protein